MHARGRSEPRASSSPRLKSLLACSTLAREPLDGTYVARIDPVEVPVFGIVHIDDAGGARHTAVAIHADQHTLHMQQMRTLHSCQLPRRPLRNGTTFRAKFNLYRCWIKESPAVTSK